MIIFFSEHFDERIYARSFAKLLGGVSCAAVLMYAVGYEKVARDKSALIGGKQSPLKMPIDYISDQVGLNADEKDQAFEMLKKLKLIRVMDVFFTINHERLNQMTDKIRVKVLVQERRTQAERELSAAEREELLELRCLRGKFEGSESEEPAEDEEIVEKRVKKPAKKGKKR